MAKPFRRLTEGLPAARRARIDGQAEAPVAEHALLRVLRERTLTHAEFAAIMGVRQASISRRENQNDMRLGTLRRYAEALGGELEIHVRFPPELVRLFARALRSVATPMRQPLRFARLGEWSVFAPPRALRDLGRMQVLPGARGVRAAIGVAVAGGMSGRVVRCCWGTTGMRRVTMRSWRGSGSDRG